MFTLGLLLTLGTVGLGLQNLPAVLPSKNDSIEPDLDLIPISIYMQLTEIAEFSNQIIRMMDFPWLTSIQNQDGSHLCSANILTPLYVLSTCQCLVVPTGAVMVPFTPRRPEDIFIIAGVSRLNLPLKMLMKKGQVRDVVSISIHPRCTPFQKFDFAVAELSHFLYFSPYIRPMSWLPYDRMRDRPYFCSTGGWRQSLPGWDRPEPYFEDMVVNEYVILRNDECPGMPELQEGAQFVCARISSMEKSLYSFDGQEETQSKTPWDHGSGLLCDEKVIAILSHHDKKQMTSIFTSLGPAVSFLRPYLIEFDRSISNAQSHTFSLSSYPLLLLIGLSSIIYRTL